jgi:hypothetical protein
LILKREEGNLRTVFICFKIDNSGGLF